MLDYHPARNLAKDELDSIRMQLEFATMGADLNNKPVVYASVNDIRQTLDRLESIINTYINE